MLLLCVSRGKGGGQTSSMDTLNLFHMRCQLQIVGPKCTSNFYMCCFELMDWILFIHWSLSKESLAISKENSLCVTGRTNIKSALTLSAIYFFVCFLAHFRSSFSWNCWNRNGGREQFSNPLLMQVNSTSVLHNRTKLHTVYKSLLDSMSKIHFPHIAKV